MRIVIDGKIVEIADGATFTPAVSESGEISFSNDKGLPNPPPVNIRGPQGEPGKPGEPGEAGPQGPQGPPGDSANLEAGNGISLTESESGVKINVELPVKEFTDAEYEALSEEEQAAVLGIITDAPSGGSGGGSGGESNCGSAGEIYSTEETRIGTWIDGKPLYRKVFRFTTPDSTDNSSQVIPEIEIPDVEEAIKVSAKIHSGTVGGSYNQQYLELPAAFSSGYAAISAVINSTTNICKPYFYVTSTSMCKRAGIAIFEYTKTTDTAE